MFSAIALSQRIAIDQLGKEKWLRYNGGVAANAVLYDGTANRQNLTYFLTGNLNFNIAGVYNIPLSFTYSNQDFNFPNPFNFNRLSLHPSYKWATAHIGDVNMTFSPYTLAGHQFTGAGFDLNPEGKFQISAMYGRLLRATEYNVEEPRSLTAFRRMGYGLKTSYDFDFMRLGVILFKATDDVNSLQNALPVALGLSPKENTVLSFESEFRLFKKAQFRVEYAISGVTEDSNQTETRPQKGLLSFLLNENITTNYYNALNASFNYPAGNGTLGVGYERIDPDYKTLGAYFFNNDLENITVNASQTIFNNKVNLNVNAGVQQDNLNKAKTSEQQRIVSSFNANYTPSERLGINASYSNFQSFTNIRDQFDFINQVNQFDNVDTLNYRQVNQNANLGLNYVVKKTESRQHSANLNLIYQNSSNEQEGTPLEGGINSFYNGIAAYTMGYPEMAMNISLAGNVSYNTVATDNNLTIGPTLAISKQFFDQQLRTNFSTSYNSSYTNGQQEGDILNFRLGGTYLWLEKHNFTLNVLMLFRNAALNTARDLTLTFGYSYTFDNFKLPPLRKGQGGDRNKNERTATLSFRYRNATYSGTLPELNQQLTTVFNSTTFDALPAFKRNALNRLLTVVTQEKKTANYKPLALGFLRELYAFEDFQDMYDAALFEVIEKIKIDQKKIDFVLEKAFVETKTQLDEHPLGKNKADSLRQGDAKLQARFNKLVTEHEDRSKKLAGHRWMQERFNTIKDLETVQAAAGGLGKFKAFVLDEAFKIYDSTKDNNALKNHLEREIIDFFYKQSLQVANPDAFELRYINKN